MKILAFDIGGTFIKWGLFENGQLIKKDKFPTDADKLEGREIIANIAKFIVANFPKIDGIGISSPGVIDDKFTIVGASPNIKNYIGTNIPTIFKANKINIPIHMENDANTAIMGEIANGALKGHETESSVMITLGTGIGGANVYYGKLEKGTNGWAGEYGHYFMEGNIMEQRYSTVGLTRLVKAATGKDMTGEEIWLKKQSDKTIADVVDKWRTGLALGVHYILMSHDPKNFVIGGGAVESSEFKLEDLKKELYKTTPKVIVDNLNLQKAKLGNDAALWGAMYLWKQHNK